MVSIIEHINSLLVLASAGFVLSLIIFLHSQRRFVRIASYNLAILFFLIALAEAYAWFKITIISDQPRFAPTNTTGWVKTHEILGYAPIPSVRARAKKETSTAVMYDATYTINEDGQRIAPRYEFDPALDPAVVMFGCSYTFGEGVEDHETAAYKVGAAAGLNVYNFAFNGYGPQQMIAALEQGLVRKIVKHNKVIAIYQAVPFHIPRAAGFSSWDKHSAKYVLAWDGSLRYDGHFDDHDLFLWQAVRRSYLYKLFLENKYVPREKDIELYLEIIRVSAKLVAEQFDGSEFHVILWPNPPNESSYAYDRVREGLLASGIRTHLITDILKDYERNPTEFQLNPREGHPNPLAHTMIADYICEKIIGEKGARPFRTVNSP
jgi:hypothetical protein